MTRAYNKVSSQHIQKSVRIELQWFTDKFKTSSKTSDGHRIFSVVCGQTLDSAKLYETKNRIIANSAVMRHKYFKYSRIGLLELYLNYFPISNVWHFPLQDGSNFVLFVNHLSLICSNQYLISLAVIDRETICFRESINVNIVLEW